MHTQHVGRGRGRGGCLGRKKELNKQQQATNVSQGRNDAHCRREAPESICLFRCCLSVTHCLHSSLAHCPIPAASREREGREGAKAKEGRKEGKDPRRIEMGGCCHVRMEVWHVLQIIDVVRGKG